MDDFIDDASKKSISCYNEVEQQASLTALSADENDYMAGAGFNKNKMCKNSIGDDKAVDEMSDIETRDQTWKPIENLSFYSSAMATETENLLLPEISHTNSEDCNFTDFNEFNLCVNNILNYDNDEVINDCLSPRTIIPTDGVVLTDDYATSEKAIKNTAGSSDDWSHRFTPRSDVHLHNIFDIVHLSEDIDLESLQTDSQLHTQSGINIESGLHFGPTTGVEKDEIGVTQERQIVD
ncbi:unnamed protein product [Ceratitis capitata]|uniref:(Mediterranean fruit fly) hypothetical protein n=1 Tax=Ceratitis capitata TaxID=7213 RepID=W8BYP9_CERCA|nr:unnamed protein product [Ceratitis capitata]